MSADAGRPHTSDETSTVDPRRTKSDTLYSVQQEDGELVESDCTYDTQSDSAISAETALVPAALLPRLEPSEEGKTHTLGNDELRVTGSELFSSNVPPIILIDNEQHKDTNNLKANIIIVYACLVVAQILWSGFHVLAKYTFTFFSPFVLPSIRCAGAIPIFFCHAYRQDPHFYCISPKDHKLMLLLGLLLSIAQQISNYGLDLSDASVAGMVQPVTPIFTTMLALMLKREKATILKMSGIGLAIIGAFLMVLAESEVASSESSGRDPMMGTILLFIQAILTAVSIIIQKPMLSAGFSTHTFTFYLFLYGGVFHAIVGCFFVSSIDWSHLPLTFIPIVLYTFFFTSFIAYSCFVYATKHLPASLSSLGIILQSFFSPLLGAIFLNEVINYIDVLGGIAIIAGIAVVVWDKHRETQLEPLKQLTARCANDTMFSKEDDDETYMCDSMADVMEDDDSDIDVTNEIIRGEEQLDQVQLPTCSDSAIHEMKSYTPDQNKKDVYY